MHRLRRYRNRWLIVPAAAISLTAQAAAIVAYEQTRPIQLPMVTLRLDDAAASWDYQLGTRDDDKQTSLEVVAPKDAKISVHTADGTLLGTTTQRFALGAHDDFVKVDIATADGATWSRQVEVKKDQTAVMAVSYVPARGQVLVTKQGDKQPLLRCSEAKCAIEVEPGTKLELTSVVAEGATFGGYHQFPMRTPKQLVAYLGDPLEKCTVSAADIASGRDIRVCDLQIKGDTDVAIEFGLQPTEVEEKFVPPDLMAIIDAKLPPPPAAPPTPIEAEKLDEKPIELAMIKPPPEVKPPQLQIKPPPPPPPPPPEKPKTPPPPPPPNQVMVEVKDDKHVVDKAPDDATKLSDKNRNVAEETRAKETNLDKESEGKQAPSKESKDNSPEVGGPDDKIRQLEDTKKTTDDHLKESDHSGKDEVAKGVIKGESGDKGEEGTGEKKEPGQLAMRGIEGRGSVTQGDGRKIGKRGAPGLNTPLAYNDYERLMGKDNVDKEREISARKLGAKKGHWERKLDAIKSSLENFVPDVRPGNQSALKTRAHPYALYIARMHRRIHELWGFGFLQELDDKGSDYPLNNMDLWVNLEVSVNADGTLHKVTIAKTSGKTEFDVAAVDTVVTAGPYEPPPEAIRSVDGRVYLRWGFYRNWRQCGTFNVEPYILTDVPKDSDAGVLDDGAMVKNIGHLPKITKKGHPIGETTVTPDDGKAKDPVSPASSVTDKDAVFAANQWISAFSQASVEKLVKYSMTPFYAAGKVAASNNADLQELYSGLLVESGPMRDWKLKSAAEYGQSLPEGNVVLEVHTTKESFAIVLTKTKSNEWRASQLAH